jgi:hypothetical protein
LAECNYYKVRWDKADSSARWKELAAGSDVERLRAGIGRMDARNVADTAK